jgi:hypothetical protein
VARECPDYRQGGYICKHVRAYVLWEQRQQPASKPKASYSDFFPSCRAAGCDNDPEPRERYCHKHVLVDGF